MSIKRKQYNNLVRDAAASQIFEVEYQSTSWRKQQAYWIREIRNTYPYIGMAEPSCIGGM